MNDTTQPLTLHLHVIAAKFSVRNDENGALRLTCDLPGARDSLKVEIQGRFLTVSTAEIERTFSVGYEYDLDRVETKYEDGVLTVVLPPAPVRVITFKEQAPAKVKTLDQIEGTTKAHDQIEAGIVNPASASTPV